MVIAKDACQSVSVLGCTGSIGANTLHILEEAEKSYRLVALTANHNAKQLILLATRFLPECVAIADETKAAEVKGALASLGVDVLIGDSGVAEAAARSADWIMSAIVGEAGLVPTYHAVSQGSIVALANKESLVCGGELIMAQAKKCGTTIIPVDSEHSALFQTLNPAQKRSVEKLILTASGGPFRTWEKQRISAATAKEALNHPNWDMGNKVTIDSATMMNKGLEVIEAHHLFGFAAQDIDVVVHPESIVHSMVEYVDGSVLAQMGTPDMKTPIAVALAWPERMVTSHDKLDLVRVGALHFEPVDNSRFPCLALAYEALKLGQHATLVLNAANEVAVEAFLGGHIGFYAIAELIENALEAFSSVRKTYTHPHQVLEMGAEVKRFCRLQLKQNYAA